MQGTDLHLWVVVCCLLGASQLTVSSEGEVRHFLTQPPDIAVMEFVKLDHLEARTIKLADGTITIPSLVSNLYMAAWCKDAFFLKEMRSAEDTNLFNSDPGDSGFVMAGTYSNRTWRISGCQLFYWDAPTRLSERFYWLPERPANVQPNPPRTQALVAFRTVALIMTLGVLEAIPGTWAFTGQNFVVRSTDGSFIQGEAQFCDGAVGQDVLLRYAITNGAKAGLYESRVFGTRTMGMVWLPTRITISKKESAAERTLCEITVRHCRPFEGPATVTKFDPFSFIDRACIKVLAMKEGAIYEIVGKREIFRESLVPGAQAKPIQLAGRARLARYTVMALMIGISGLFVLGLVRRVAVRKIP